FGEDGIPGEIINRTDDSITVTNIVKMSQNIVSASQSMTLRWQSILLALFVIAVMLVYLSIRFRFEYGLGAVLCLLHDTLMMLGFISVAGIEFDMTVVAGILTFMGYTVNDTIVIYDRIRENHTIMKEASLNTVFNTSINQTINRSLITSFTTLLAVLALFFFAGEKLRGFSSIMIFGVIMGTYSSIFIASPIVLFWFKAFAKKENKKRATTDEFTQKKEETTENAETAEENSKNDNSGSEAKLVLSKKKLKKIENMKKD
ncbi:MAG: protein translocase subunit SecF, partial [Spirochaetales bacterium]|nr:protein translocase subunit SecF [Spirochaetales bacterium]